MPHEIRTSTYAIFKKDIVNKSVKIITANDVTEFHIYCKQLASRVVTLRPTLKAIIVCREPFVRKYVKEGKGAGMEVFGTRYTEDALRIYLRKTDGVTRIAKEVRFK